MNSKRNHSNYTKTWRLNNTSLNNPWVTEEIKEELCKFPESNDNGRTTHQNLWGHKESCPQRKVYSCDAYIGKIEHYQIQNLNVHLKVLENKNNTKLVKGEKL